MELQALNGETMFAIRHLLTICATLCAIPAVAGDLLEAQGHTFRWGIQTQTQPQVITYAVLQTPFSVPGGRSVVSPDNCGTMKPFDAILSASPLINSTAAADALKSAFARWEGVANVKFVATLDPAAANIVVGASGHSTGRAFANISYQNDPSAQPVGKALGRVDELPASAKFTSVAQIEQAYVCLNPSARWKTSFDGNLTAYDLAYTFTHEIGHAIGLDHPGRTGSIMAYRYDETTSNLQRCRHHGSAIPLRTTKQCQNRNSPNLFRSGPSVSIAG